MNLVGFILLTLLAVGSAVVVIQRRNPVESALALAVNLLSIAGFYLLLNAQFIALLQVIVYAGAIMVLVLFVIMLLNLPEDPRQSRSGFFQLWLTVVFAAIFAVILRNAIRGQMADSSFGDPAAGFGTVSVLGHELFGRFFYPFEVISLLLVVAMVGSVLLAKRRL
jgi:NADH-quinone oxidoreductase subunit J